MYMSVFVYIPAVHCKLLSLKRGNNGNMVAGHLGNWGRLPSSCAKTTECTAVSGTCQARRRNKSDRANCRFASPHSEKLQRLQKNKKKKKKDLPSTHPSSILSFPPHDFASLIFKGPGDTFARRSESRAEKVMLTFCWLDAECCLVQYRRGRVQSEEVSKVFGRADERDGEGVERRPAFPHSEKDLFADTQAISRIGKHTSQILHTISQITFRCRWEFWERTWCAETSESWARKSRLDSSTSEMKSMASFWSGALMERSGGRVNNVKRRAGTQTLKSWTFVKVHSRGRGLTGCCDRNALAGQGELTRFD